MDEVFIYPEDVFYTEGLALDELKKRQVDISTPQKACLAASGSFIKED